MTPHFWVPASDARHAVVGIRHSRRTGHRVRALCGVEVVVTLPASEDPAWLVPSCTRCWQAAKDLPEITLSQYYGSR